MNTINKDVVIYGATFSACICALRVARTGKQVAIVAPEKQLGGMITGGLGITDAANVCIWWGEAQEFADAMSEKTGYTTPRLKWNFPARYAKEWVDATIMAEDNIELFLGESIDSVARDGYLSKGGYLADSNNFGKIREIITEQNKFKASVFIDGSYSGMLIAKANVKHGIGRQPKSLFHEIAAGRLINDDPQFKQDLTDEDGDLMNWAQFVETSTEGGAMAMGYRLMVTNDPARSIGWPAPPNYNENDFQDEILDANRNGSLYNKLLGFRVFKRVIYNDKYCREVMPNYETATTKQREEFWLSYSKSKIERLAYLDEFATNGADFGGPLTWEYASTTDEARRKEIREQIMYKMLGRFHTFAHSEKVPKKIRDGMAELGLTNNNFESDYIGVPGWSHELYQRNGRYLQGASVINEKHVLNESRWADQVAVCGYFMDSKYIQQIATSNGKSIRDGDYQATYFETDDGSYKGRLERYRYFGIPMSAMVTEPGVCDNLISIWCISATNGAFNAIRLEPSLCNVALAGAEMAIESIESNVPASMLCYSRVSKRLKDVNAVLYRYFDGKGVLL